MKIFYAMFIVVFLFVLSGCFFDSTEMIGKVKEINTNETGSCELRVEVDNHVVRFIYISSRYNDFEDCLFLQKEDKINIYKRGINYFYNERRGERIS